jgi:Tol biopolymer transport system component
VSRRAAVICESKTSPTQSQSTHPHPYVTPDLKWIIFNSSRSGSDHIYAARIPDELMTSLLA